MDSGDIKSTFRVTRLGYNESQTETYYEHEVVLHSSGKKVIIYSINSQVFLREKPAIEVEDREVILVGKNLTKIQLI